MRTASLALTLCAAVGADELIGGGHGPPFVVGTAAERRTCPQFQSMSCLTDLMEKICENELEILGKDVEESVWMCCCPLPYTHCDASEWKKNAVCGASMRKHVEPLDPDDRSADAVRAAMKALQDVRADMYHSNPACAKYFAAPEPYTKCGQDTTPTKRTVMRNDIFCETVTWQWEELGDGDEDEFKRNGCEIPPKKADASAGARRKNGSLKNHDEL